MRAQPLHVRTSPIEHGTRYRWMAGEAPLPCAEALRLLAQSDEFRAELTARLAASAYRAFRWETPPMTRAGGGRPFEFVLVDSPQLAPTAEPETFKAHFIGVPADVDTLAIPNLGHTATLVVPRERAAPVHYRHLASFVRGAPAAQVDHLWRCVAEQVDRMLDEQPLWLSTAGGGVAWLHVRIERTPKYYAHRPYADAG